MAKEWLMTVRGTEGDRAAWMAAAVGEGRSLSGWVRWVCNRAVEGGGRDGGPRSDEGSKVVTGDASVKTGRGKGGGK